MPQVRIPACPGDPVANVSQVGTLDKSFLTERVGALPSRLLHQIEAGLLSVPKILALLIPEILAHSAVAGVAGRDRNLPLSPLGR